MVHCGQWTEDIGGFGKAWRRFDHHNEDASKDDKVDCTDDVEQHNTMILSFIHQIESTIDCDYIKQVDTARDLVHPGIVTNEVIAKKIAQSLNL